MKTLHEKLRIKENDLIGVLNAPKNIQKPLEPLPPGLRIEPLRGNNYNHIYWFVKVQEDVRQQLPRILEAMNDQTIVWTFFPKGTSGIQTDLTRDKGWDEVMSRDDLRWISMISYDETWTAIAFRNKTERDKKQELKTAEREIFKWADSKTKTIRLPEDIETALSKNKPAKENFDALAFSHRREYIEWVVTAKQGDTRSKRIAGMIDKLLTGRKNPSERS